MLFKFYSLFAKAPVVIMSLLTEMPKCFLWKRLTEFSEANPLQIKLERKATGKIMDTKPGHSIFYCEHPYR